MAGHIHQSLLNAIAEFTDGYGKDERYKDVLEGLKGAVSGITAMGPAADGGSSPGELAAKLAADPDSVVEKPPAKPVEPAPEQPKSFADATALAKERMAAA